jgi:hypothetical protein
MPLALARIRRKDKDNDPTDIQNRTVKPTP